MFHIFTTYNLVTVATIIHDFLRRKRLLQLCNKTFKKVKTLALLYESIVEYKRVYLERVNWDENRSVTSSTRGVSIKGL